MKHGLFGTYFYSTWSEARSRCRNKQHKNWEGYGGRGIRVCKFINESPANLKTLLGDRPKGRTLDRIDVDGNYSCGMCAECKARKWPMNLRWATRRQQQNNRRNTAYVADGDSKIPATYFSAKTGLNHTTVLYRIKSGWSADKIYTKSRNSPKKLEGKSFGKLRAIKSLKIDGMTKWKCKCKCGRSCCITQSNLLTGNSTSCGSPECSGRGKYQRKPRGLYGPRRKSGLHLD